MNSVWTGEDEDELCVDGWGWDELCGDGWGWDELCVDGWGWGRVCVPMQFSTSEYHYSVNYRPYVLPSTHPMLSKHV